MTTTFLNALKQKANEVQATQIPTPKPDPLPAYAPIVNIDLVLNRNRIDVFFNEKPSDEILCGLRGQGFHYRPSDKAWYHQDTQTNRDFLNSLLKCDIAQKGIVSGDIEPSTDYRPSEELSPEFVKFRSQTNELLEHLKCEPADLMLIAIDALHKSTFSRDS